MMLNTLLLLVGVALLTCGGEALIRGSLAAARRGLRRAQLYCIWYMTAQAVFLYSTSRSGR